MSSALTWDELFQSVFHKMTSENLNFWCLFAIFLFHTSWKYGKWPFFFLKIENLSQIDTFLQPYVCKIASIWNFKGSLVGCFAWNSSKKDSRTYYPSIFRTNFIIFIINISRLPLRTPISSCDSKNIANWIKFVSCNNVPKYARSDASKQMVHSTGYNAITVLCIEYWKWMSNSDMFILLLLSPLTHSHHTCE